MSDDERTATGQTLPTEAPSAGEHRNRIPQARSARYQEGRQRGTVVGKLDDRLPTPNPPPEPMRGETRSSTAPEAIGARESPRTTSAMTEHSHLDGSAEPGERIEQPRSPSAKGTRVGVKVVGRGDRDRMQDESFVANANSVSQTIRSLSRFASAVVLIVGTAASLIVAAQTLLAVNEARRLGGPAEPIVLTIIGLLCAAVVGAAAYVAYLYVRLPRSPRLSRDVLEELDARIETRSDVLDHRAADARKALTRTLTAYRLEERGFAVLRVAGMKETEVDELRNMRQALLTGGMTDDEWIRYYDNQFLGTVDRVADRVVSRYARSVGALTAAAPSGIFDNLIVISGALRMIGDLCAVYGLRAGRVETFVILTRAISQAAAADQIEDASEAAGDLVGDVATAAVGALGGLLGTVAGKGAEGAAHWFLFRRLGGHVRRYLRPIEA